MDPATEYSAKWVVCEQCGTTRPPGLLTEGVCSDQEWCLDRKVDSLVEAKLGRIHKVVPVGYDPAHGEELTKVGV
jgi:hypothetical protein